MRRPLRRGAARDEGGDAPVRERQRNSLLTRLVDAVFDFVKLAEFEILFVAFLVVFFLIFKDLTSRPHYNQILVRNPEYDNFWDFWGYKRKE